MGTFENIKDGILSNAKKVGEKANEAFEKMKKENKKTDDKDKKGILSMFADKLDVNGDGKIDLKDFVLMAVKVPGVNINRREFLKKELGKKNDDKKVAKALETNPKMAKIDSATIEYIVDDKTDKPLVVKDSNIEFSHISFQHDEQKEKLFTDFDLKIPAGKSIGLVGVSGSGKTTLTKLLLRFADVGSGAIYVDGQDIRDVTQNSLRENIAYVPQESSLFHRTVFENIAYGKPGASKEEVLRAAKLANADEFIQKLPDGYETVVGERGVKLSGGQRQRIAIARAILKDAPILVLDEATSALDSESEALIQGALTNLMKGRTSIVVAHRLSTIAGLDEIVVLDDGKIVEQGTHRELLARGGEYQKLWSRQSGAFLDED